MSLLGLSNITKIYQGENALLNVTLEINKGEVLAIIGPSGSGKTTLLKIMNLIVLPDSGSISFGGNTIYKANSIIKETFHFSKLSRYLIGKPNNLPSIEPLSKPLNEYRRNFGLVFQEYNLWPNLTLFENIAAPLKWSLRLPLSEIEQRVEKYSQLVQIEEILDKYPNEASGGQKQRAAIARALVTNPLILLLDEITSALDPELISGILELIEELKERGHTMVIVTHYMSFARRIADRLAFIQHGVIHDMGPVNELFDQPASEELNQFLGYFTGL